MTDRSKHVEQPIRVTTDLVEYVIVAVRDADSLSVVADALAGLVGASTIRILDLVVVVKDSDGAVTALEPESIPSLRDLPVTLGDMLSEHDIQLASVAIDPDRAAVVLVTEDRWAEPLSVAARRAGGQIIAGERIPSSRVASVLARDPDADMVGRASPRASERNGAEEA